MTAFDIIVGVPLILLLIGGWPALTFYVLRNHTSFSRGPCIGTAFLVGIAFVFLELRFATSLPSYLITPMTSEQRTIESIAIFFVILPYLVLFVCIALGWWRKRGL